MFCYGVAEVSVLTAGHLKITRDARFKIVGDYNLQIAGVRTEDAGDYICQIGDQETRDQVHTVEILGRFFCYLCWDLVWRRDNNNTSNKYTIRTLWCKSSLIGHIHDLT